MVIYQSGFGNSFESEALPGALPAGRHSPQRCPCMQDTFIAGKECPRYSGVGIPATRPVPVKELRELRCAALPLVGGLVAGSMTAIASAVGVAALLGASHQTIASLAPKSATTPIAMAVAVEIGGIPSLTAGLVISAGISGAIFARSILHMLRRAQDCRADLGQRAAQSKQRPTHSPGDD